MSSRSIAVIALLVAALAAGKPSDAAQPKGTRTVGVLFVVHGGSDEQDVGNTFDSTLQFFQYDPNNVMYRSVIWNPAAWPGVVSSGDSQAYANAATQLKKYAFASERIGKDPANRLTDRQFAQMTRALQTMERPLGVRFVADIAQWIGTQNQTDRLPWPRYLYYPKVAGGSKLDYCGSSSDGGPWKGCNPERYDVDGPAERVLKLGAEEIVMVDLTVGGVRFWKSYDVVSMTRRVVDDWNQSHGTDIPVRWLNDPTDLMKDSYPKNPPNWTRALGPPKEDSRVPLAGRGNPVIDDPLLTEAHVAGIVSAFNPRVAPRDTAVMFINHATRDGNETYDPKIDDTLVLDERIKRELLRRYPTMRAENIVGAWMGLRQPNPAIKLGGRLRSNLERTREMRGEDLGGAWLYESDRQMPGGDHGYRYWEALDLLRERGVRHIVVIFSQIVIDSALNMVEVPNQIAKEIGRKTWLYSGPLRRDIYPGVGHPFASHWGIWVDTQCKVGQDPAIADGRCCLTLGGCGDGRPYPPARQTPIDRPREDVDASLAFDVPAYGQLGYDQAKGAPDDGAPVQEQYRGTWAMWNPPNDDARMGKLLAGQVARYIEASNRVTGRPR